MAAYAERLEEGIYRRPSGTFLAQVSYQNRCRKKTFPTIEEARAWRQAQVEERPVRVYSRGIDALVRSTWGESEDILEDREERRRQIQEAPRTSTTIGGQRFTLVQLPPAPYIPTKWDEFRPIREVA
jgi:hypothetical protein